MTKNVSLIIYDELMSAGTHPNYRTCLCILCLHMDVVTHDSFWAN